MSDSPPHLDNTAVSEPQSAALPPYDALNLALPPVALLQMPPPPSPAGVTQAVKLCAAAMIGFLCGASLVAALWIATASSQSITALLPAKGNQPEAVISAKPLAPNVVPVTTTPTRNVSGPDLAFGENQVARMVKDRPEMLRYVKPGEAVWRHCARAFGGEAIGERVYWDSTPPQSQDTTAEHLGPYDGSSGYIRVRREHISGFEKGVALTCEELWSSAVYELENIRGTKGFNQLYEMALEGKLTRAQWIRENTRLEYEACRRTGNLYRKLWVPMARKRGVPTSGIEWYANVPSTYEGWIALYNDPNGYPWNDTGRYWDEEVEPYLKRTLGR